MAADGVAGAKGNPQFLGAGAPATAVDLNLISQWAADNSDISVADNTTRNGLSNKRLGMQVHTQDTDIVWLCTNATGSGTWSAIGGNLPIFSVRGSGSGQGSVGAWTVMNGGLGTPDINRGFTSWSGGALTIKTPGLYEVAAGVENVGTGTIGVQVAYNTTADSNSAPFARQSVSATSVVRSAHGSAIIPCVATDVLRLLAIDTFSGAFLGGIVRDLSFSVKYVGSL